MKDFRPSPDKGRVVTQAHAGDNHQASGVRYDVKAPTFTPALSSFANTNTGANGNMQMGPVGLGATYHKSQQQAIPNGSAPAVGSTRVSPPLGLGHAYQHPQHGELDSDNNSMANLNAVQMPTVRSGAVSQQQHGRGLVGDCLGNGHDQEGGMSIYDLRRQYPQYQRSPVGINTHSLSGIAEQVHTRPYSPMNGTINGQCQLQGHANGNNGLSNNQEHSPTLAIGGQPHQNQGGINSMAYNSEQHKHHVQGNQFAQAMCSVPLHLQSPDYEDIGHGMHMMPANRRLHQDPRAQNGSSGAVNGYAYGLTSSVSDGSMTKYYTPQSSPPMDLIRVDREPRAKKNTVGPLAFGTPIKEIMANRSEMLQTLTENGKPRLTDVLDTKFLPFTESYRFASPTEDNGVIVIQNVSHPH